VSLRERLKRQPPGYNFTIGRILAIYAGLMVTLFLAALDQTIVATALPRIVNDLGGIIPISSSILEHHINKFKVGGSEVSPEDEEECRRATSILTLGPASILGAKKIVQSIVDAATAPAKKESFARFVSEEFASDPAEREKQLDANPGLWIRLHPNVSAFVLPDLF